MSIQLIVIIGYLILTVVIGLLAQRKSKSSDSFVGSGLGVIACVAAGTGEWLGGSSTTGVSEYGYLFGLSGAWYTIANGIGICVLAIFFAKLYRSLETVTVPGIVGHFIGKRARTVSSVLLIFVMEVVGVSQVIAAGTLGVTILGLNFNVSVIVLGIAFIVYTMLGGMNAVSSTNTMHLLMMYGGVILALIFALKGIGGGQALTAELPDTYFAANGAGTSRVASWLIASILGACTAQAGIQPILAAKNQKVARRAAFLTAAVVAPFGILTALLGMIAKVQFPDLANAKLALPTLMMNMQPIIGGIVLASIFAAVLSTVSPLILASGTMFTKDLFQKSHPDASDKKVLLVSRISTALAGVVCIIGAMFLYNASRVLDLVYFAYTLRGAIFVVLLFGMYWKKTSQNGAIVSMIVTGCIGLMWVAIKMATGSYPIASWFTETYAAVACAIICTLIFSYIFPKRKEML